MTENEAILFKRAKQTAERCLDNEFSPYDTYWDFAEPFSKYCDELKAEIIDNCTILLGEEKAIYIQRLKNRLENIYSELPPGSTRTIEFYKDLTVIINDLIEHLESTEKLFLKRESGKANFKYEDLFKPGYEKGFTEAVIHNAYDKENKCFKGFDAISNKDSAQLKALFDVAKYEWFNGKASEKGQLENAKTVFAARFGWKAVFRTQQDNSKKEVNMTNKSDSEKLKKAIRTELNRLIKNFQA